MLGNWACLAKGLKNVTGMSDRKRDCAYSVAWWKLYRTDAADAFGKQFDSAGESIDDTIKVCVSLVGEWDVVHLI